MKNFNASCSYFDRWVALTKLGSRVFVFLNLLYLVLFRLPWDAGEAGKADACAGCPNQQICSTAPKGPDPSGQCGGRRVLRGVCAAMRVLPAAGDGCCGLQVRRGRCVLRVRGRRVLWPYGCVSG